MLSYCTSSMSGTTLVTSTEAQRSLQNSKFCQKYENPSIKAQKRIKTAFLAFTKIAVRSQISSFNAESAPMLSYCAGNMPGTTVVIPKKA